MKGHTKKQPVRIRIAKIRKKLRGQLKELTHAHEFYVNNRTIYLPNEIQRVHQAILHTKMELLYPSLY